MLAILLTSEITLFDYFEVEGLSISYISTSIFGKLKSWLIMLGLYFSIFSLALFKAFLFIPVANSFFNDFLKFLKETRTAVILSKVLLAIDAFNISSTLWPQI